MATKLRVTEPIWRALRQYHLDPRVRRERISYLFGTLVEGPRTDRTIIVADQPVLLSDDCYITQTGGHVSLCPLVQNSILAAFAKTDHDCLINVHDHFFAAANTTFSSIDTADEIALEVYLRKRFQPMLAARPEIGRARFILNVALVLDQAGCDARFLDGEGRFKPIDRIDIVGERPVHLVPNSQRQMGSETSDDTTARHTDFISTACQRFIANTTFAIVGCGGLGSIAAEALMRLGARHFVLIDDDSLEQHNLNRWQGGSVRDVGRPKVAVLASRLRAMAGSGHIVVDVVQHSALSTEGETALKQADVIIGGLDNHLARFFLNRFAVQYVVPYFDAGVNILAGEHVDFQSRYFAVIPGSTPCMECTGYELFDRDEINRILMDDVTAAERKAAGYVQDRPEIIAAASAYALNLGAVAILNTELMNWICGFRPLATCASERWRDGWHQRSDRANHPEKPDPECPACGALLGAGEHAELPRPRPEGHAARLLEEARVRLRARSV